MKEPKLIDLYLNLTSAMIGFLLIKHQFYIAEFLGGIYDPELAAYIGLFGLIMFVISVYKIIFCGHHHSERDGLHRYKFFYGVFEYENAGPLVVVFKIHGMPIYSKLGHNKKVFILQNKSEMK